MAWSVVDVSKYPPATPKALVHWMRPFVFGRGGSTVGEADDTVIKPAAVDTGPVYVRRQPNDVIRNRSDVIYGTVTVVPTLSRYEVLLALVVKLQGISLFPTVAPMTLAVGPVGIGEIETLPEFTRTAAFHGRVGVICRVKDEPDDTLEKSQYV